MKDPKEFKKMSKFVDPEQIPEEFGGSNTQKLKMGSVKPLIDIKLYPEIVNTAYLWEKMNLEWQNSNAKKEDSCSSSLIIIHSDISQQKIKSWIILKTSKYLKFKN